MEIAHCLLCFFPLLDLLDSSRFKVVMYSSAVHVYEFFQPVLFQKFTYNLCLYVICSTNDQIQEMFLLRFRSRITRVYDKMQQLESVTGIVTKDVFLT